MISLIFLIFGCFLSIGVNSATIPSTEQQRIAVLPITVPPNDSFKLNRQKLGAEKITYVLYENPLQEQSQYTITSSSDGLQKLFKQNEGLTPPGIVPVVEALKIPAIDVEDSKNFVSPTVESFVENEDEGHVLDTVLFENPEIVPLAGYADVLEGQKKILYTQQQYLEAIRGTEGKLDGNRQNVVFSATQMPISIQSEMVLPRLDSPPDFGIKPIAV